MIITGTDHFQNICKEKLIEWYHKHKPSMNLSLIDIPSPRD